MSNEKEESIIEKVFFPKEESEGISFGLLTAILELLNALFFARHNDDSDQ